jgi:hypothetical protein
MDTNFIISSTTVEPTNLSPSTTLRSMVAANVKLAFLFIAEKSIDVSRLGFLYGDRTGTPPTYQISLQALDASGLPTGTPLTSATFTPPASAAWNGTFQYVSVTPYSITAGTPYAIVIEYSSGTIGASNVSNIVTGSAGLGIPNLSFPTFLTDTGAGYVQTSATRSIFAYGSSSQIFGFPFISLASRSITSAGHRLAAKITLPSFAASYKVAELRFGCLVSTAGQTFKAGIWDASGTELVSTNIDTDIFGASALGRGLWDIAFPSTPTLTCGVPYYFGVERVGTYDPGVRSVKVGSNEQLDPFSFGRNAYAAYWNGTAWTEYDTELPIISLLVSDITPSSSGGFALPISRILG